MIKRRILNALIYIHFVLNKALLCYIWIFLIIQIIDSLTDFGLCNRTTNAFYYIQDLRVMFRYWKNHLVRDYYPVVTASMVSVFSMYTQNVVVSANQTRKWKEKIIFRLRHLFLMIIWRKWAELRFVLMNGFLMSQQFTVVSEQFYVRKNPRISIFFIKKLLTRFKAVFFK